MISLCAVVGCSGNGASVLPYRPVDEDARGAALEAIGKKCEEIAASGKDKAGQNEAIAEHVRTYPDIAFASTSVDGVVALFYDGQPIIILNNIEPGGIGSSSSPLRQPDERTTSSMPWGKPARLMNGFPTGSSSIDGFPPDPSPDLAAILSKKGYVPNPTGASVEDFKSVGGDAVLHIRTHGGGGEVLDKDGNHIQEVDASGKPKEKDGKPLYYTLFGLWTTDTADSASFDRYKDDVVAERLVRMYQVLYPRSFGGQQYKGWHWGITHDFVDKEWDQLAMNAYIHVSACSAAGSGVGSQVLREKIQNKAIGSVYMGWSAPAVVAQMDRAAKYLMDRLTGANVLDTPEDPKEDPPQRPFDLESLGATLGPRATSAGAQLTPFPDKSVSLDTYVLAPSLATVQVWDREDMLQLTGLFDFNTATTTVTVGGSPCAVQPGGGTRGLMCKLDKAAKGEVVVTVEGRESNRVKLSSWRGKVTYAVESTQPGLSQVWTLDVHLRGDVGDYRDKPGKQPVAHKKVISMAKDSKATVVAAGSVADPECNVTWTAKTFNVEMWGKPSLMDPGYFLIFTGVVDDGDPGNLWFELIGRAEPCYDRSVTKTGSGHCSAMDSTGNCALPTSPEILATKAADPYYVGLLGRLKTPAALGPDGTIATGQVNPATSLCCGGETGVPWDYSHRLSWDAMAPEGGTGPDRTKDER
jgi:hypothetical protein